ncbi:bestrophin-2-like [Macrosteles quadrilineatus]|uniref:bestrophin-2-like n=1 Tax=Macrosteles quadrilineatus TaxID=74068 RepID=UPI0023E0C1E7|nr:bestrophin-2-like [Macrosteles quadrilineatus]XP_054281456.1 bestrophin-2-like [Macrosteles quadrilineatus]
MTVTYTSDVANGGKVVSFSRVLMRWKGSLYKLIWQDLLCYLVLFVAINLIHTYALPPYLQTSLQRVKLYLANNLYTFPVPFVLSFFVENVATKWWHQYQLLPSADTLAIYTNATIPGKDDQSRIIRRTIVRYAVLSLVLTMRNISVGIRKRFPTIHHVQEAGLILEEERNHFDKLETQATASHWIPLVWAANVATYAKTINKISSDHCLKLLITELTAHRNKLGTLVGYDLVNIPLVYTQTMVVVVMSYVVITLICHQPITIGDSLTGAGGFTMSSLTNFIIYVGLMKVATVMLNPFGEDDDDFELNAIVDRHLTAAYMIVDEMHEEEPEVVKDAYWDEIVPKELPYTVGSMGDRKTDLNSHGVEHRHTKRQKNKASVSRKNSAVNYFRRGSLMSKINSNKNGSQKDLLNCDENDSDLTHVYENVGFYSSGNPLKEEDEELYDCADATKSPNDLQRPSTSKQYFHRPTKY